MIARRKAAVAFTLLLLGAVPISMVARSWLEQFSDNQVRLKVAGKVLIRDMNDIRDAILIASTYPEPSSSLVRMVEEKRVSAADFRAFLELHSDDEQLVNRLREMAPGRLVDALGTDYELQVDGDVLHLRSAGIDRTMNTRNDIEMKISLPSDKNH